MICDKDGLPTVEAIEQMGTDEVCQWLDIVQEGFKFKKPTKHIVDVSYWTTHLRLMSRIGRNVGGQENFLTEEQKSHVVNACRQAYEYYCATGALWKVEPEKNTALKAWAEIYHFQLEEKTSETA